MQVNFKNIFAKILVLLVGAAIVVLAGYNIGKTIISKTTDAKVVKVLDSKQVKRGKGKAGYKYYTDYLVKFETESGKEIETLVTEMLINEEWQYQSGDIIKVDVFSDNTAVAHVHITEKIPMLLLGLFGLFLFMCGIKGKVNN